MVIVSAALIISSCTSNNSAGGNAKIETTLDSVYYSLGVDLATNVQKSGGDEFKTDALLKGIQDVYNGEKLLIEPNEGQLILRNYFEKARMVKFEKNLKEANEFLEKNGNKSGVNTTESGLQYEIITEGTGPVPGLTDMVKVNYIGTLIDGREFDRSKDTPASFRVNGVIKGWTEALQLMPTGSKWKLFVPPDLAYGENPRPGGIIEPNHALIFEIELLEIVPPANPMK
ncbi:MAG: FKBP-type peptidyl-prolyl cis-trans isomerase [Bacteroidales bacterium]|nr:FKBP-type peptidyl-prolyl cis-trans isomerase [Bacteroidales bacterium]